MMDCRGQGVASPSSCLGVMVMVGAPMRSGVLMGFC